MFFSDAVFNGKTTEPRWFKNIRILVAIGLVVLILYHVFLQGIYLKVKISEISHNATMPGTDNWLSIYII